jgi:tetratricopeptide (TPR) repeat protein
MKRVVVVVAALLAPAALPAQQDSLLAVAMRLATEGQGDSARALVRSRLRQASPADSLFSEILYAAGVVASDIDSARTYFRRVSIEHSRSNWADRALLRLTQLAFAAGDYQSAARSAERVLQDYPLSLVHADAAYWAARVAFELGDAREACRYLLAADSAAGEKVELLNQVRYYLQRCTDVIAAPPVADTLAPDTAGVADTTATSVGPTFFSVQVAAVSSAAAADELMQSLHAEGYQSRVFRDADGLLKIRVGRFANRREAERLRTELRRKLGGQPFVVEER